MAASQSGCIEEYSVTAKNYLHSLVLWLSQNTVAPLSDACMAPDDARAVLIKLIDLSLSDISISQSVKLALACMARDLSNDVKCKTENGDQTALSIILERTSELPDTFGDDFKKDAALLESMLPNIMQSSDLRISKFRVTY